ncbi:efflux RND transporter permease subunit [Pseudoduganella chitinolytica]|uniref:Efflux RND transporter permease subunit n=1 Tax=Pseudoduganella chitinolytica TaxID=34070 RepID=A0ABY8BH57_9BURK|nr:efflux RND transporter permease subunit [Pseudoduganella chitinolytica]WEF33709.1 efflux RND transporter permease subunit [Pseudoduganella chitinolytica]
MSLAGWCIGRPVAVLLLTCAVVIAGLAAYRQIPVAALPSHEVPVISVQASLPGASPATMAASVALPLEKEFAAIAGVTLMTSTSTLGATALTLEFGPRTDINAAAVDVQAALLRAQRALPRDMTELPSYRKTNPAEAPVLSMELTSPSLDLAQLNDYAENLIGPALSGLPGVAQLAVLGQKRFAVRVRVDLARLKARDLTTDELAAALQAATSHAPLGVLDGPQQTLVIQGGTQPLRAADFAGLVVAMRAGLPVRLADVAQVEDSWQSVRSASSFNGERSIVLLLYRQAGANTLDVVASAQAALARMRGQLPASVAIHMVNDRSVPVRAALHDVHVTLVLTIGLVVLVIALALRRAAATLIPAVTIPVALLGALALLYWLGYSLDNVSLLGITLAVGLVVDDAIVVLENIVRHVEEGAGVRQAALAGTREVTVTVLSISATLVAVFMPVFFMPGVMGRLFHEFAVVVGLAVLVSALVALTLVPMLASRLLPGRRPSMAGRPPAPDRLAAAYARSLDLALRHRGVVLLAALATLALSVGLYTTMPQGLLPDEDLGQVRVTTEGATDISPAAMLALHERVAAAIARDPNVRAVTSSVSGDNTGSLFLLLQPRERRAALPEVLAGLRRATAGIGGVAVYFKPVQNFQVGSRPSKSRYQYTLQSVSAAALDDWAERFIERLRADARFEGVTSDARPGALQATLAIDRDKAARHGVSLADVRSALYGAFGERQVGTIQGTAGTYAVLLEAAPADRRFQETLGNVAVRGSGGQLVSLSAIARVERTVGPVAINHQGQLQAVTLSFNLAPGVALSEATAAIDAIGREIGLPASIVTRYGGDAAVFQQARGDQVLLIAAALGVVYVLLGILYESFVQPLTILAGLPSAAAGALLTLWACGLELTMIAVVGILLLIGIVKKNAIMIVDVALQLQRGGALAPAVAVREACVRRFRPIMMTTAAALMGALPIALGLGAGAELRQPLGLAVAGGLLLSQLVTLYVTPVTYVLLDGLLSPRRPPGQGEAAAIAMPVALKAR